MDKILRIVIINGENNGQSMSVFDYTTYPFRVAEITLPECKNGCVYMITSIKDPSFVYIGRKIHKDTTNKSQ